jgi:sterol desaturase/sphingolipid hydroxylase (fatty acid hydroxylase superfamily)
MCYTRRCLKTASIFHHLGKAAMTLANPLDLTIAEWLMGLVGTQFGLLVLDRITMCWAARYTAASIVDARHVWTNADTGRVVINMFVAQMFLMHCVRLVNGWPTIEAPGLWSSGEFALRTVAGVYALFFADDMLYTPLHRIMHARPVYAWVHAAHHAQAAPHRGCWDAVNETGIEQASALLLHLTAIRAVHATIGLTAWSVGVHLLLKTVGSCLNHVDASCRVNLGMGVRLDPAYHRTHHSRRVVHYAQFVPWCDVVWDRLW